MKFSNRLIVIVAVVVVTFAGVSIIGLGLLQQSQRVAELSRSLERLAAETWHLQSLTFELRSTSNFRTVIPEWRENAATLEDRLNEIVTTPEAQRLAAADEEFAEVFRRMSSLIAIVQAELDEYLQALSDFTNGFTEYPTLSLDRLIGSDVRFAAIRVATGSDRVATYLDNTLQSLIDRATVALERVGEGVVVILAVSYFAVVAAASVICVVMILFFMRTLRRRFATIGGAMERLAGGDLTVRLDASSRDEVSDLARSVQSYIDEFARVVARIKGIAHSASMLRTDLVAASEQSSASVTEIGGNISAIGTTIEDLDRTIEQTGSKLDAINASIRELEQQIELQTRSVEESSSAVEEMAASVTSVSRIAGDRMEAARRLKSVTDEGHRNVEATDERVSAIAESVDEIVGIITVINTIASQTSILSMNAAIEAAHAGEYGRGFSVVAAEIRRLSESTNENAKRIKEQLQHVAGLAGETKEMSATTRESFTSVESEVASTANALQEISATMNELAQGSQSVLTATADAGRITQSIRKDATTITSRSDELTRDMHHVREISASVRGGIQEIGVGTREINQMVDNLTTVTRELTDQVDLLGESVSRFQTASEEVPANT